MPHIFNCERKRVKIVTVFINKAKLQSIPIQCACVLYYMYPLYIIMFNLNYVSPLNN